MQVIINGEKLEIPDQLSIEDLIQHLKLTTARLAVERNREVVRRTDWPGIQLEENDQIEIIHFVGGGC